MENWIGTYRKMGKNDKWKNDMKQLEQLINASDDNLEIVSQCRKFVEEVISGKSLTSNRVATSHGNHGNHGKVMELFLVMEKVMEFQKSSK